MQNTKENKIILVVRRTRLEELIARFNTLNQAKFYIEHLGADFSDYEIENQNYKTALEKTKVQLQGLAHVQVLDRAFLPNFIFGKNDTVLVLGQDGLVANTIKYLNGQPVIAVNPDPKRWEGVLLPFEVDDVRNITSDVLQKFRSFKHITMAQVDLNNGQKLYAVNDFFIGPKTHTSIRYQISLGKAMEQHSSSGIIVSTGLGSTGWLKSILTEANGISAAFGNLLDVEKIKGFNWDSNYLYYTVREPWPSKTSQAQLVFGKVTNQQPLVLTSQMPERGVIFSDGIEDDFLEFNSGVKATIGVADKRGYLVV